MHSCTSALLRRFAPLQQPTRARWTASLAALGHAAACLAPAAAQELSDEVPEPPEDTAPVQPVPGRNPWRYILVHHSAGVSGNLAAFERAHTRKGWEGVAYHFVITNGKGGADGGLEVSPRWWKQKHGAHAGGLAGGAYSGQRNDYNEFGIGICLVGNFEKAPPTAAQLKTLAGLITRLRQEFQIPPEEIVGHRHVRHTACPGRQFPWRRLFAMLKLPHPQHLYYRTASGTVDRCTWCLEQPQVPSEPRTAQQAPTGPVTSEDVPPGILLRSQ